MPATIETVVVQKELNDLKHKMEDNLKQQEELASLVEQEERDYTDDESELLDILTADFDKLENEYQQKSQGSRTSLNSAGIQQRKERMQSLPDVGDIFMRSTSRNVSRVVDRWTESPTFNFSSVGEFMVKVHNAETNPMSADDQMIRLARYQNDFYASVGMDVPSDGGFLMAPEFSNNIFSALVADPVGLLGRTTQFTLTNSSSIILPANAENDRRTGQRWGGIKILWEDEGGLMTDSQPRLRRLELMPRTMHVFVIVNNSIMQNSTVIEQWLNSAAVSEINWEVTDQILNGSGTGRPLGLLKSGGTIVVAKEGGQTAATVNKDNVEKMYERLFTPSYSGALWLYNKEVWRQLNNIDFSGPNSRVPVMLPSDTGIPSIAPSPNQFMFGIPLVELEQSKGLGAEGDIALTDMSQYYTATRGGIATDMSIHVYFDRNQTAFRFSFAIDGQPFFNTPVTPANGTNTLAPFVTLAERT